MITPSQRSDEYTALSDRMGYLLILRLAMAGTTIAWAAIRPEALGTSFSTLLAVTAVYVKPANITGTGLLASPI